jgi:hypothetical protein
MSIQSQITAIDSPSLSRFNTGLGNVLFQFATGYSLSKKYGIQHNHQQLDVYTRKLLSVYGLEHRTTFFRNIEMNPVYTPSCILTEQHHYYALYDTRLLANIQPNIQQHIQLNGYLQSHLYFHTYRDELLEIFKMDSESRAAIFAKYLVLADSSHTCISLHFRTNWGFGITYCIDYYKEAIQWFKENVANPHFLVFSDNINTIRDSLPGLGINYTIVEGDADYKELWTMTLCKHNVLSFSTFSWWGAYLNTNPEKKVFFPYDALRVSYGIHQSPVLTERLTQHYLPEWIPLRSKSIQ